MKLKVKNFNLSTAGPLIAVLNAEEARKLDLYALDRIRTSIDTMVSDGFEAQINYSRLGIDRPIDQIGILIADISDRNQEIMKTIGIIDNYLEILDRKRY